MNQVFWTFKRLCHSYNEFVLMWLTEPSAPQDLQVSPVQEFVSDGKQRLNVTWQPPLYANGNISNYTIIWWSEWNGSYPLLGTATVNDTTLTYIIENLTACTKVSVNVSASNGCCEGNHSVNTSSTFVNRMSLLTHTL